MIWLSGFVGLVLGAGLTHWVHRVYLRYERRVYLRYERRVRWWVIRRIGASHRRLVTALKPLRADRQLLVSQREAIATIIAAESGVVDKTVQGIDKLSHQDLDSFENWTPGEQARAGRVE